MSNVEQISAATRDALGPEASIDYIDDQLLAEYEASLREGTAETVGPPSEAHGSPEARTTVRLGNSLAIIGSDSMYKTNGAGQPCGTGLIEHVRGAVSVHGDPIESCPRGVTGYRYTFTFSK